MGEARAVVLARSDLSKLLEELNRREYTVLGPTVQQGAIVYGEIAEESDLPIVYGIEGARWELDSELTEPVRRALDEVVRRVLSELGGS